MIEKINTTEPPKEKNTDIHNICHNQMFMKIKRILLQSILLKNIYIFRSNYQLHFLISTKQSNIIFIIQQNLFIQNKKNMQTDLDHFRKAFADFIKTKNCIHHQIRPTFVCIDQLCRHNGIICSHCLTINGIHKNHDAIQIHQFMKNVLKAYQNNLKRIESADLIDQIQQSFQNLLKRLTQFHESISNIVKQYISKKNEIHVQKQNVLFTENSLKKLKQCKFSNIQEMNTNLKLVINRIQTDLQINQKQQDKNLEKLQYYLNDLIYQQNFANIQLTNIQNHLRDVLSAKSISPLVLHLQPLFNLPNFIQNEDFIYIGETRNEKPHGKGISYYKSNKKIAYGNYQNGHLEGYGEIYFNSGDYYLGNFKYDKKQGRGVYKWSGKQSNLYYGQFKGSKRNGRGTFWWPDGSRYQGHFKDGMQSGIGCLYHSNNYKEYQGEWLNGMFHGQGIQYFENGEKFEGSFKQDKFDGTGIFYKLDSIIHGIWKDNQLEIVNMIKSINQKQK